MTRPPLPPLLLPLILLLLPAVVTGDVAAAAPPPCVVALSVGRVDSQATPSGPLDAVQVEGAAAADTQGGRATAAKRCVYFYHGDDAAHSYSPTYKGSAWPVATVPLGCAVSVSPASLKPLVTVAPPPDNTLRVAGLPVYQWTPEPSDTTCHCNVPAEGWSSISPSGGGAAFNVTPVAVPPSAAAPVRVLAADGPATLQQPQPQPSFSGGGGDPNAALLRLHGRLMTVAFVALLPLGVATGRLIQKPGVALPLVPAPGSPRPPGGPFSPALLAHVLLQARAAGTALVAAGFALVVLRLKHPLTDAIPHGLVGVSATALVFAQFVGGMVRPHRGASALRVAWELWHSMLGRAAIVLGVFNVFSGLLVARDIGVVANYNLWTAWAAASLGFSWIAGALVHKGVEQRERARELDAAAAGDGGDRVRGDDKAAAAALA